MTANTVHRGVTRGRHRRPSRETATLVGGIDGSRGGWVLVVTPVAPGGRSTVKVVGDLREVVSLLDARWMSATGITTQIGLPDGGARMCDLEARQLVGPRATAVFPAPMRTTLGSASFEEACARSRAASGRTMSRQTFANLLRTEMVDALMVPERQGYLVEVHPEVSFATLAGRPMANPKTVSQGRIERMEALRRAFPDIAQHIRQRSPLVKPDDVLDAFVAAWSARRWVTKNHLRLGGDLDGRGLRMEIIA